MRIEDSVIVPRKEDYFEVIGFVDYPEPVYPVAPGWLKHEVAYQRGVLQRHPRMNAIGGGKEQGSVRAVICHRRELFQNYACLRRKRQFLSYVKRAADYGHGKIDGSPAIVEVKRFEHLDIPGLSVVHHVQVCDAVVRYEASSVREEPHGVNPDGCFPRSARYLLCGSGVRRIGGLNHQPGDANLGDCFHGEHLGVCPAKILASVSALNPFLVDLRVEH